MQRIRASLVVLLIVSLVATGCQNGQTMVTEYRPRVAALNEKPAPQDGKFELVRWTPVANAPATQAVAATPVKQLPVRIEQVYVPRGRTIGFRRTNGQLIAIADQTNEPLSEGHYEWRTIPDREWGNRMNRRIAAGLGHVVEGAEVVVLVVGVVVVVGGLCYLAVRYGSNDNGGCSNSTAGN